MNVAIYNNQFRGKTPKGEDYRSGWYQIEVAGEHPARLINSETGEVKKIVQVIDEAAMQSQVKQFHALTLNNDFPGLLVDVDHLSHDPNHDTKAQAWMHDLEIRNGHPWGFLEWTADGFEAVSNKAFKFFSTEYASEDLEDLGGGRFRPLRLAGLALTNRPNNKGGKPITNRSAESAGENPKKQTYDMKSIAEKLGLAEDATEEEILEAIGGLQTKVDEAAAAAEEAEVEEILNRHESRIPKGSRDDWKANLIANREGTEKLLGALPEVKAEETKPRERITNRDQAAQPGEGRGIASGANDDAEKKAASIRNRAHQISKSEGIPFNLAFSRAQSGE